MGNATAIFTAQSLLAIKLETNIDLTDASVKKVLYKKPGGDSGSFDASSLETGNETNSIIVYNFTSSDLDEDGLWKFQSFVTISGKDAPGDKIKVVIENKLTD